MKTRSGAMLCPLSRLRSYGLLLACSVAVVGEAHIYRVWVHLGHHRDCVPIAGDDCQ
jgi:hypothetical protein